MAHVVIIVASPAPVPRDAIQRVAELLTTDAYSLRLALQRSRPLILNVAAEAAAEEAVAVLTGLGHEAYAMDLAHVQGLAAPLLPRTLALHRDHVRFVMAEDELVLSKWDNIFLLVHGRCRRSVRRQVSVTPQPGSILMRPTQSESLQENITDRLDLYFYDGSVPVRVDSGRFSFRFLGSRLGLSDAQSLQTTIRAIRKLAPQAILDDGFERYRRTAGSVGRSHRSRDASLIAGWMTTTADVEDDGPRFDLYSRISFLVHLKRAEGAA